MKEKMQIQNRNIMRCIFCGAEVYTKAEQRNCYKCETKMEIIGKEY